MPLVLEIEHLLGVAFAARGPEGWEPDWPPQPDRVFSALVAAWAARGEHGHEREALEWLERQEPPEIEASGATARPAPASFVPPNDKLKATGNPGWRTRQPRRFPAALPYRSVVRLIWTGSGGAPVEALDAVARDVAYLGHSASLTRCRFSQSDADAAWQTSPSSRRIYPGRLKELETAFQTGRRPSPGSPVKAPRAEPERTRNAFSPDWLTFEMVGGDLDLRAAPIACKALIKAIMSGYEAVAGSGEIPAWVSGHDADGSAAKDPHLAVAPLAYAGFEHSDGGLMGFALVPPAGHDDLLSDATFRGALLEITRLAEGGHRNLRLVLGRYGALDLRLSLEVERASLDPRRYAQSARRWATVTPVVLDRHLKNGPGAAQQNEIEALITDSCARSLGVRPTHVVADKHSAIRGAPSAYPSGGSPRWTAWRVPEPYLSRRLTHAVFEFPEPVTGPILIGAGRHCGLGVCLPLHAGVR